jgi:hypothetical protein
MNVSLKTPDSTFLLAGETGTPQRIHGGAAEFVITAEVTRQIVRRCRSPYGQPIDRGNLRTRVSFRSHRQFSTPQAAEEFLLGLHEDERSGELIFDTGVGKRKLLDAVVPPPRAWIAGPMLIVAYDAAGGGITTAGPDIWLPSHIDQCVVYRMVNDSSGYWFEVGFESPVALLGNAADGWTDPDGNLRFRFQRSETLTAWDYQWITCPTGVETTPDGFRYWARSPIPAWWSNVVCDLTLTANNYGKSITGISVGQVPVSLAYPYAMPSQAATLQTALRAAGYTGAVVSSVSKPLAVGIKNHTSSGLQPLTATMSGTNVTMVQDVYGNNITAGMSYPYSMPSQKAALQTALRAAGKSGAVVKLYADEWTIFLPDRPAANPAARQFMLTYTPDDPYPAWDVFGNYVGIASDIQTTGTFTNVRPGVGGAQIPEANKQFGRMQVTPGPNYQYYGDTPP